MTTSSLLMKRLVATSKALKQAAQWNGSRLAVDMAEDHFLYEQYCYFHIALQAAKYFKLKIEGQIDATNPRWRKALWPKAPANKENFSYLSLVDLVSGKEVFQLCAGTNVADIDSKDRAPDISLQKAGSPSNSTPTHDKLLAIWDAKHTSTPQSPLSDKEVADFIFTFVQLGAPIAPPLWAAQPLLEEECIGSGLITNAKASTETNDMFKRYNVSETSNFPGPTSKTRP